MDNRLPGFYTPADMYYIAERMAPNDPRREKIANNISGSVVAGLGTAVLATETIRMAEYPTWSALFAAAAVVTGLVGVVRYVNAMEGTHRAIHSNAHRH